MCGIFQVMAQRRQRVFDSGVTMRVSYWTQSWIANRSRINGKDRILVQLEIVKCGDLHKKIVGMLPVNDGPGECCLALLEQLGIEAMRHRSRLETCHHPQRELPRTERALPHQHEPIAGENFVITAWAALLLEIQKCLSVKHEH